MAIPFLIPALKVIGGAVIVSGIWGAANVAKETGDAIEHAGDAAEKSVTFMDRVIVLTIIGGVIYMGAKAVK